MNKINEFILCAAIYYNDGKKYDAQPKNIDTGFVVCGRRHHNCYATVQAISSMDEALRLNIMTIEKNMTAEEYRKHQGFITSLDRFVDRREAYKIAKENKQIQYGEESSDNGDDSMLISEHLY